MLLEAGTAKGIFHHIINTFLGSLAGVVLLCVTYNSFHLNGNVVVSLGLVLVLVINISLRIFIYY